MNRTIITLIFGCILFLCSCSKFGYISYHITDLHIYNQDNSGPLPVDTNAVTLPAKSYCIRLEYSYVYDPEGDDDRKSSDSQHIMSTKLTGFKIYSLTDFDSTHPALSPLNDCFLYNEHIYAKGKGGEDTDPAAVYKMSSSMKLMKLPAFYGYRQFVVEAVLDSNKVLSDTVAITLF